MIARISPRHLQGNIAAIPSKSEAHRALICAALSDSATTLFMGPGSEDIDATMRCLVAFGAEIRREGNLVHVHPVKNPPASCEADCGESGSTLRFLLPVAGALGIDTCFRMHGRLPQRPIVPLDRELIRGGCTLERPKEDILRIRGQLQPGSYELPGNVSSQYISGMLFALTLLPGESKLRVTGKTESVDYIEMTRRCMDIFGAAVRKDESTYFTGGCKGYTSPGSMHIGGDWSNAAFWLCADAIGTSTICVNGLDPDSAQGDRRIMDELAKLSKCAEETVVDATDIPDLIPALAACACARGQALRVIRAQRLRIKESDRLMAIVRTMNALGADLTETSDGLIVAGSQPLRGGEVDSYGDHRIAMMAAIASIGCSNEVIIRGAEAVNKSYPGFWQDFSALGGCVTLMKED